MKMTLDKKVDWTKSLPKDSGTEELFQEFKEKAEALTVKVINVKTAAEAEASILKEITEEKAKIVCAVKSMELVNIQNIQEKAKKSGVDFSLEIDRDIIEKAQIGISEFDLGIADLGTIVQDADDVQKRLVSTLPPIHIAVLQKKAIVDTLQSSLEVINKTYNGNPSNFIAYVTGPSKTSDIERVLTIGVHGPGKLIVVVIDQ
ncbi:L-lactate dehydrogenase complex protein LldG [Desulfonispora thiosulfatigenes DSM 11270]|uniref:L-lactate dehydrogenase complex protein LldG n=1 Tax=Desulfonispora thiosulfatigenes DSM 11270 TaxID=656914 RepID=A0A1W1V831_DESTI|nr:lactate utilization protein [Desulfonispora thiosulfatigenes]SMB89340.1 L-lactate dehydrogenase complex protein LldG [Desulfonispora thiosulfatigenes DSM 11270]